jgi:hypothetical protein
VQWELAKLKEEQAKEKAEWETAQKLHEGTLYVLRAQIGEVEHHKSATKHRKNDAFESLLKMTEKAELFETNLKGKRIVWLLCDLCSSW